MNSSKSIDISKSSLISLKAELSRKQDEVLKAKSNKPNPDIAHHSLKLKRNLSEKKKLKRDAKANESEQADSELIDEDDDEALKKSRDILEVKSKLYDQLQERVLTTDHGKSEYLVNFDQKTIDKQKEENSDCKQTNVEKLESEASDVEEYSDDEDDWVDFTDALGRSRRCLRKDLEFMKQKDDELLKQLKPPTPPPQSSKENDEFSRSSFSQELLSNDMHLEMMRRKWELQEQKLLNKTDIHYQDLLFDEARTHGVGYYSFSTDEEERAKQQNELLRLRQDTIKRQEEAQGLRNRRNQQLQARLKAARIRNRQRLGLPPEDDEKSDDQNDVIIVDKDKDDNEEDKNKVEELEKSLKRAAHVRPWDIGKDGVKPLEVMSQEEWVENKREERLSEFAPPSSYIEDSSASLNLPSKRGQSGLFFTSKKLRTTSQESASTSSTQINKQPIKEKIIKIRNELSDDSSEGEKEEDQAPKEKCRKRAEIPPPLTMEYFGGTSHKPIKEKTPKSSSKDIEDSISKGLKFLNKQNEIKEKKREKGLLDII